MTRPLLMLVALMLAAPAALAINMTGFRDAPITRLNNEELKAFRAAVMKALDEAPDGATVEWKAEKTRFVGKITPKSSHTDGKMKCRDATIESDAHDRYQRGLYSFCKAANGEWQFKSPRPAAK
jgi:surface antigen